MKSSWRDRAYRIYDFLGPMLLIVIGMGLLFPPMVILALAIAFGGPQPDLMRAPPGGWRDVDESSPADELGPEDEARVPVYRCPSES